MEELVFTPSAVLGMLSEIAELQDLPISFEESANSVKFTIGDSQYSIDATTATEVIIDEDALDDVATANEEGYQDLEDNSDIEFTDDETVEGGIIKELAKTLLVGGLVRLTSNAIKKS